jgi:hypothetical protein
MTFSLPFAFSAIRFSTVVLLLGSFSSPLVEGQAQEIYQPHSAGAVARTDSAVRPRRRNAKPQVQNGPETLLYTFQGGSDGGNPDGHLIFDSSGNLYGGTEFGRGGSCSTNGGTGCSTVFELSPNGSGGWTETILI